MINSSSEIDFQSLAKEHGYVKARQLLKQETIKSQQQKIKTVEHEKNVSKQPLRLKEAIKVGNTFGNYHSGNVLDKIASANQKIFLSEASKSIIIDNHLNEKYDPVGVKAIIRQLPKNDIGNELLIDETMRQSLRSSTGELLIPNRDVDNLPNSLGDTLHLQLAYIQRLSCTRNNMKTIISQEIPQLSMYHLRYMREINVSYNKIGRLPADMGVFQVLETLNLSQNMLASLPPSISDLKRLKILDLSGNSFASLPEEFCLLDALEKCNLSDNLFSLFPNALVRLRNLKSLNLSKNSLQHAAILPALLTNADMWLTTIDRRTGGDLFMNILTREKVKRIEYYTGAGINKAADLHVFQPESSKSYRRRKMWLSVCQIHEWEPDNDVNSGLLYYRNNVSGTSSWEMPPSLDTLGNMITLEDLSIRNNSIKILPSSFVKLVHLRSVSLVKNRISALPEEIGQLVRMEMLDMSSNELKILPTSLCKCVSLKTLMLCDNHLLRLPEDLGTLPKLTKLDVSVNRLRSMPFSLGNSTSLTVLIASENPLVDPPMEEFSKGLDSLKWYLRNRYMIEERGMPPAMEFQQIGICSQVTILKPEFVEVVRQMIRASAKDGLLNLQLLGLTEIPSDVLKMHNLKRLKLDFNDRLSFRHGFSLSFKHLQTLSLRCCKMAVIPENIFILEKITSLNLEENRFETIPNGITELTTLTKLDISKNKLYTLPPNFECLTSLRYLNLESNNLETIPVGIGGMLELRTLILSKNRIVDFPDSLCDLNGLKVLNIEKNKLQFVPVRISVLNLVELRIGHNRVEQLPNDIFNGNLGASIKIFSCCENNILELPSSLVQMHEEGFLEGDYNPLVSPPSYLLSEGLHVVQNYLKIRFNRRMRFEELMTDEDFVVTGDAMSPVAHEVLADGTGFLTPDDLAEFDTAVDEYLNGEYYKCPATGEEIVACITRLREVRETELYLSILYTFLQVVGKIVSSKDKRFTNASILQEQRPWGRKGENCNVWVVSLPCLLRDAQPNPFQPQGRPSLFSMIAAAMPRIAFPFTVDLLKDSMRLYESPYGQIADTEQVVFPSCDCVDDKRNKPLRHNPCSKAAVVIVKSVYVPEEATRRAVEEDEYLIKFEEVEENIRIWLVTEEGKKLQEKECKKRKEILREEIKLREEMVLSQQIRVKKSTDRLKIVRKRKLQFETNEPFESHGLSSMAEAIKLVSDEEEELGKFVSRVEILGDTIKKLKETLNQDMSVFMLNTANDLVQKYCFLAHAATVNKFRKHAAKHGLKRHWDGDDGKIFDEWKILNKYIGDTEEMEDLLRQDESTNTATSKPPPRMKKVNSTNSLNDNENSKSGSALVPDDEDDAEFNWDDTQDMAKFQLNLYTTYKNRTLLDQFDI